MYSLISRQLNLHNKLAVIGLSRLIGIPGDTVRRDPQQRAKDGKIADGVLFPTGYPVPGNVCRYMRKRIAAQRKVSLIKDGRVILTGGVTPEGIPSLFEYSNQPHIEMLSIADKIPKKMPQVSTYRYDRNPIILPNERMI